MSEHRAGYACLIGRPNAGKSTLLNQMLQEKLAITSALPQTTRNRIMGIHTTEDLQVVLVDTPGIHRPFNPLNESMVRAAVATLREVDVICWLVDAAHAAHRFRAEKPLLTADDREILARVTEVLTEGRRVPVILAPNKVDAMDPRLLLPLIDAYRGLMEFAAIIPISALTGDGTALLLDEITKYLPAQPAFFPADQIADQTERFVVAEIIRGKIMDLTREEVPYSSAVEIELFDETQREGDDPRVHICARIIVARSSQKGILIGKGGEMIKRIGTLARQDVQQLLGARVHLELFVAVEKEWTHNPRLLRELGYR